MIIFQTCPHDGMPCKCGPLDCERPPQNNGLPVGSAPTEVGTGSDPVNSTLEDKRVVDTAHPSRSDIVEPE